ncbi:MAG: FeoA family protein [Pseudomonadota bacterium]
MRLDILPLNTPATIAEIDWPSLGTAAARRLKAFGFEDGANIEALHFGGIIAQDPIAVRIGRMTIALRREQAASITVTPQ